jgi:DsbC/DsbD-like thiol-disulfide interchange protein
MIKSFLLFSIFLISVSLSAGAQQPDPASWKFSVKKGNTSNAYIVTATATLQEGWHIFAPDPGGDGLLIPTEVTLDHPESFSKAGKLFAQRRPVTKEMDAVGMVNYYEGEIDLMFIVETTKPNKLSGIITYQCCNDRMCLPPKDMPFDLSLKP